ARGRRPLAQGLSGPAVCRSHPVPSAASSPRHQRIRWRQGGAARSFGKPGETQTLSIFFDVFSEPVRSKNAFEPRKAKFGMNCLKSLSEISSQIGLVSEGCASSAYSQCCMHLWGFTKSRLSPSQGVIVAVEKKVCVRNGYRSDGRR